MSTSEDHHDDSLAETASESSRMDHRRSRRSFPDLASGLLGQKTARRPSANTAPISAGEIVNGLDRREFLLGAAAAVIAVALSVYAYYWGLHSSNPTLKASASTYLIAMLIGALVLGLGTVLRRRAMVGFASFFFGLEQISFDSRYAGLVFLAFGAWLIWRVMQKSKTDRALGITKTNRTANTASKGTTPSKATTTMPKASKRYTPPKASRSARR